MCLCLCLCLFALLDPSAPSLVDEFGVEIKAVGISPQVLSWKSVMLSFLIASYVLPYPCACLAFPQAPSLVDEISVEMKVVGILLQVLSWERAVLSCDCLKCASLSLYLPCLAPGSQPGGRNRCGDEGRGHRQLLLHAAGR